MKPSDIDRLKLRFECDLDWSDLSGDERKRWCARCEQHVVNISALTRKQAVELRRRVGPMCITMEHDDDGRVRFQPEAPPSRATRLKRAAGGALLAGALTACGTSDGDPSASSAMPQPDPAPAASLVPVEPERPADPSEIALPADPSVLIAEAEGAAPTGEASSATSPKRRRGEPPRIRRPPRRPVGLDF
jgi:hypothetical protein